MSASVCLHVCLCARYLCRPEESTGSPVCLKNVQVVIGYAYVFVTIKTRGGGKTSVMLVPGKRNF